MNTYAHFFTLWKRFAPSADRDDRLLWVARQLGRALESMKELREDDIALLVNELKRELRGGSNATTATPEQLWKIRLIEQWLQWASTPERLFGFLRSKFKGEGNPAKLTARQAWRAIEALFHVAAGGFKGAEKTAEVKRIKELLKTWRTETQPRINTDEQGSEPAIGVHPCASVVPKELPV